MKSTSAHTIFVESNLSFSFDNQWIVKKFDDHSFYQQLAGKGLKGVDFIGIYQQKTVVLMEVKNYIDRYLKDTKNPSEDFLNNQAYHLQKIAQKFVDSLRLIEVVHQSYRRKIWFRFFEKTLFKIVKPDRFLHREFGFWRHCWQLIQDGNLRLIFWIEIDRSNQVILEILDKNLPTFVEIVNQKTQPFGNNLKVEFKK